jgi:DNA-binding XRE family transcriptional regulator
MDGYLCHHGYLEVRLNHWNYRTHRMVALAFHERPTEQHVVNHIDGNKTNNRPENLEWVTAKGNVAHAFRTGLVGCGSKSNHHKLDETRVAEIKRLRRDAPKQNTQRALAARYGVSRRCINWIETGRQWCHVVI